MNIIGKTIKDVSMKEKYGSCCLLFNDNTTLRIDAMDGKKLFLWPNDPSSPTPGQKPFDLTEAQSRRSVQRMVRPYFVRIGRRIWNFLTFGQRNGVKLPKCLWYFYPLTLSQGEAQHIQADHDQSKILAL